jgi:hypothetical protein
VGDGGRGVPKSTHDATETDHADQNETHHWTERKQIENFVPFRKEKKLNGGVAILLKKKNRFWLIL